MFHFGSVFISAQLNFTYVFKHLQAKKKLDGRNEYLQVSNNRRIENICKCSEASMLGLSLNPFNKLHQGGGN
jgi:hypothetical protein